MIDYQGTAIVISAGSAAVATLGGLALQIMTFRKMNDTHKLVNGMSEAKEKADTAVGEARGLAKGIAIERADPHTQAPPKIKGTKP